MTRVQSNTPITRIRFVASKSPKKETRFVAFDNQFLHVKDAPVEVVPVQYNDMSMQTEDDANVTRLWKTITKERERTNSSVIFNRQLQLELKNKDDHTDELRRNDCTYYEQDKKKLVQIIHDQQMVMEDLRSRFAKHVCIAFFVGCVVTAIYICA
jgi:hypothetical protein